MSGTNITTDLQRRTGVQPTDRLLMVNPGTGAMQYLEVGDVPGGGGTGGGTGSTNIVTPIQVELATATTSGKVSLDSGAFTATSSDKISGFIAVTPGETVYVSLTTDDFNTSPPIMGTGLAGYASNNYGSFVTALRNSFKSGNLMGVDRYNQAHGTTLGGPLDIIDEPVIIPSGVNYVVGCSKVGGVTLSIKALRNSGTVQDSITQLYNKVNSIPSAGAGSGTGGSTTNDFTNAYKDKIDSLPDIFPDYRDGIFYLPDFGLGDQAKVYVKNRAWYFENLATTFGAFQYPIGYAYDLDKKDAPQYQGIIDKSLIVTAENGSNVSHIRGASETSWNWTEIDAILNWAKSKGIPMHLAHFFWLKDIPTWLQTKYDAASAAAKKGILTDFITTTITTVIQHIETGWAGTVVSGNVVNEAIYDSSGSGAMKTGIWADQFTDEELFELLFTTAFAASTTGIKFYANDYNQETSNETQSDTYKRLVSSLKAKNIIRNGRLVQIEGMGFQMHTHKNLDINVLKRRLKYWVDLGMYVMYTEMDVLALTSSPADYTAAVQKQQADAWINMILAYERVVPPALRGGIVFWTASDRYYLKAVEDGLQAPDSTTNPITEFPALHDYYGQPKDVFKRLLELPSREELNYDIFQDFLATGAISPLDGTTAPGKTPLVWQKVGTTANVLAVNTVGMGASQSSSNTYNFAILDYPYANRMVTMKIADFASATRTCILCSRFVDANNYIGAQATNSIWQFVKRSSATGSNVDTVLYASDKVPAKGDVVKIVSNGNQHTFYLNGTTLATITEDSFLTATKFGVKLRGFDDKFTRIAEIGANHL